MTLSEAIQAVADARTRLDRAMKQQRKAIREVEDATKAALAAETVVNDALAAEINTVVAAEPAPAPDPVVTTTDPGTTTDPTVP